MSFTFRELKKEEKWVDQYESFVNYVCEGYEENIYEYTNDITCRLFIQQSFEQDNELILLLKNRIKKVDEKFQPILIKTNRCIHGNYPKRYFWFWGIPKNSTELMNEANLNGWI